jgi:dienelactone hydrolase
MAWLGKHNAEFTQPIIDAVLDGLRAEGVTTFGATGYCFGGKYAVELAIKNVTKAIVISHPSLLQIPEDWEVRA